MDLNLLAGVLRGVTRVTGPEAVRGAAGGARLALNLQALLPALQVAGGNAAATQFAQDIGRVAAEAARGLTTVYVVQPPNGSALSIEAGDQVLRVPPALREMVLALAHGQSDVASEPASVPATPRTLTPAEANLAASAGATNLSVSSLVRAQVMAAQLQAHGQAQDALPTAGTARAARRAAPLNIEGVLLEDGAHPDRAAVRLQRAVEMSGLFFESHLAQWSVGARSADEVRSELIRLQRQELAGHAAAGALGAGGGERVAAQLDVLQKAAFGVQTQAWVGQPCSIEFREEVPPDGHGPGRVGQAQPPVVCATVALNLPHLGPIEVELKLAGHSVAVCAWAEPQTTAVVSAALEGLGQALQARGLNPAALNAAVLEHRS